MALELSHLAKSPMQSTPVRVLPGPPLQFNALWEISHITDLEEFQNGNGDGNILHNWAFLTNRSRGVLLEMNRSTAAILLSRRKLASALITIRLSLPSVKP